MRKVEGHIFENLTEYLEREGVSMPQGWSAKSRCKPNTRKEEARIQKELDGCWNRIAGRMYRRTTGEKGVVNAVGEWMKRKGV